MKKSFKMMVAAAMLFSATLSANAQFSKKENNRVPDRFHMGLRAGLTSSTMTGDFMEDTKALTSFTAGFAADFQVAPIPIFVGVGLNYMNQGYQDIRTNYSGTSVWTENVDAHCIQMPLTASYYFNIAPNLFVHPFFGAWFSYNLSSFDGEDIELDDNNFDYGLRIGAGLNFGKLYFDLGYDFGLKNWYDNSTYSAHTGVFFMTVGFNWAGSR